MQEPQNNKYLVTSLLLHAGILLAIVFEYHFASPLIVVENTNQHDVISAVVLGDTAKSKILPHEEAAKPKPVPVPKPKPEPKPEPVKPIVKAEAKPPEPKKPEIKKVEPKVDPDAISLKAQKKLAEKKAAQELKKKQQELLTKDLLADIKKQAEKKPVKKPDLQAKFAKMLKEQSEASLRQNLLDEEIKLKGKTARFSQGVVDKYKALIIQSIGEHWLVPLQADRSLTSELMIRLGPGGVVLDVKITRSSGDPSLDSSARAAVLKSSPLPVPNKPEEFEPFRQFVLKVKPENVIDS